MLPLSSRVRQRRNVYRNIAGSSYVEVVLGNERGSVRALLRMAICINRCSVRPRLRFRVCPRLSAPLGKAAQLVQPLARRACRACFASRVAHRSDGCRCSGVCTYSFRGSMAMARCL